MDIKVESVWVFKFIFLIETPPINVHILYFDPYQPEGQKRKPSELNSEEKVTIH